MQIVSGEEFRVPELKVNQWKLEFFSGKINRD